MNRKFGKRTCCLLLAIILLMPVLLIFSPSVSANEEGLPQRFDLRNVNGSNYVSSVRVQNGGTCWTHAAMAAMESNLIVTGTWDKVEGIDSEPNLAEYHLDWWNGFNDHYNADRDPPNGTGLTVHYGGDYLMTAAYLSRGDGAMRDKDAQYFDDPPEFKLPQYHRYYPMDIEFHTMDDNLTGIEDIKRAVIEHGALGTCMNADPNLRDNTHAHWQPPSDPREPNHAVAIVGWDDSKTTPAPEDGAWLIKNSWGSDWGSEGYFWISYYDKWAGKHPEMGAIAFTDVSYLVFDHALYHDYHGWRDTWNTSTQAFNKFIIETDEQMNGVSFYTTENNVTATLSVYDGFENTSLLGRLWTGSDHYDTRGLHTLLFDEPLDLFKGDDIYIELMVTGGGLAYDRTSYVPTLLQPTREEDYHSWVVSSSAPDQSFFRNGTDWTDLYYENESANFCIKGLIGHVSVTAPRNGDSLGVNYTASGPVANEIDKVTVQIDDGPLISTIIRHGNWTAELRDLDLTPGEHRLNVIATQDGCKDVVSRTFTDFIFDNDDPQTTIKHTGEPGGNGWYVSEVQVALEAHDQTSNIMKIEYDLDGIGWKTYEEPFILTESGIHRISVCAYDVAGNVEHVKDHEIRIDLIKPETDHHIVGDRSVNEWFVTPVDIRFSGYDFQSGIDTIHFVLDGVQQQYDTEDPPVVYGNGNHTLSYWSIDKAGNMGEISEEFHFKMDLESPRTQFVIHGDEGNNGWYTSNLTLALLPQDAYSGSDITYYRFNGGSWGRWEEYEHPLYIRADGMLEFEYYSKDRSGHSEVFNSIFLKIDTKPPETRLKIDSGETYAGYHLSYPTIQFETKDATSGVDKTFYQIGEGPIKGYNGPFRFMENGQHYISYYSVDRAGNVEEMGSGMFFVDLHSPEVLPITVFDHRIINTTSVQIHLSWDDPDGNLVALSYSLDGEDYSFMLSHPWGGILDLSKVGPMEDGKHTLMIKAEDLAGRDSYLRLDFILNKSFVVDNSVIEKDEEYPKDDVNEKDLMTYIIIGFFLLIVLFILCAIVFIRKRSSYPENVDQGDVKETPR